MDATAKDDQLDRITAKIALLDDQLDRITAKIALLEAEFRNAIALNPNDFAVRDFANFLRNAIGSIEGADAEYQRAHDLTPKLVAAHIMLGNLLANMGDAAAATACLKSSLFLRPFRAKWWAR